VKKFVVFFSNMWLLCYTSEIDTRHLRSFAYYRLKQLTCRTYCRDIITASRWSDKK